MILTIFDTAEQLIQMNDQIKYVVLISIWWIIWVDGYFKILAQIMRPAATPFCFVVLCYLSSDFLSSVFMFIGTVNAIIHVLSLGSTRYDD